MMTLKLPGRTLRASARKGVVSVAAIPNQGADPVPGCDRTPRQQRGGARGKHRLEGDAGAKTHARSQIDQQLHGAFMFFLRQLGIGPTTARGLAPVERAHIITALVGARSGKLHAAAFAGCGMAARADGVGSRAANLAYLPLRAQRYQFTQRGNDANCAQCGVARAGGCGRRSHGTAMRCSSVSINRSGVMPLASAS
jgi:hypothetical protein